MSLKKDTLPISTLFKLLGLFIFSIFIIYSIQWTAGSRFTHIEKFKQDSIVVIVENNEFKLETQPILISNTLDKDSKKFFDNFLFWIGLNNNLKNMHGMHVDYIEQEITAWEKNLNFQNVSEGSIQITDTGVFIQEPTNGKSINTKHFVSSLSRQVRKPEQSRNYTLHARTHTTKPQTSREDLEALADVVRHTLENGIELVNADYEISHTLNSEEFVDSLTVFFNTETKKHELDFDSTLLDEYLKKYTSEAQNAEFVPQTDYSIIIEPSRRGMQVDTEKTKKSLISSILNQKQTASIIFLLPTEPEFTTQEAEELDIKHLVSSFTTFYSCCEARSRNIQNFADVVDGAMVYPGEEFNLNTYVGQRTKENGFEPAGTLVKGTLVETTGGGISQFATTFFNAVYWGGYKNISHRPHSRYFSRYPEGIEATISWPEPHLIFRNDTNTGIVIKTSYTDTSVTVSFYGDNDGRVMVGDHRYGGTVMQTKQNGGSNARIVHSEIGEREDLREPKEIYYVDSQIAPNTIQTKTEGRPSYQIEVRREISQNNKLLSTDVWNVRYLSEDKEFLVQDCQYAPEFSVCKTLEDLAKEKEELLEFYEKLENGI